MVPNALADKRVVREMLDKEQAAYALYALRAKERLKAKKKQEETAMRIAHETKIARKLEMQVG